MVSAHGSTNITQGGTGRLACRLLHPIAPRISGAPRRHGLRLERVGAVFILTSASLFQCADTLVPAVWKLRIASTSGIVASVTHAMTRKQSMKARNRL